ncbi:invasin domain 3-containing protein, partial [Methanosarcina mazei]|uniref:invasin domain 3-containing protein n=1 Tax=Methanosarcina mazei TaxID=2209 RepID=UPI001910AD6B
MTVTVTLRDEQDNPVTGQAAALAGEVVTVPGARLTGSWTDRQDGTYVSAWTAETAGEGLKATLRYAGWESAAESPAYIITAGDPAYAESSVATDRTTYTAGEKMTVRVTLKDANGNGVSGKASELAREGVVVVPNTEEQSEGVSWSEGDAGEYTA